MKKYLIKLSPFFDYINRNLIKIELIIFTIFILSSILLQYFVDTYDLSKCITNSFIVDFYKYVVIDNTNNYIKIVDGFAVVVGGISFFIKKWVDKDTQNIVYILLLVLFLLVSHILKLIGFHITSFFIATAAMLIVAIPFLNIVYDCLIESKQYNLKWNNPKLK